MMDVFDDLIKSAGGKVDTKPSKKTKQLKKSVAEAEPKPKTQEEAPDHNGESTLELSPHIYSQKGWENDGPTGDKAIAAMLEKQDFGFQAEKPLYPGK